MAVLVVKIEAVADHKDVGDVEPAIIRFEGDFLPGPFPQQDRGPQRRQAQPGQVPDEIIQGLAGVEDVVKKKHVPAVQVGHQLRLHLKLAGRGRCPPVAGSLNEGNAERQIQTPDQVCQKDETPGEHADDGDRPIAVVGGDAHGQLADALLDPLRRDENLHHRTALVSPLGKTIIEHRGTSIGKGAVGQDSDPDIEPQDRNPDPRTTVMSGKWTQVVIAGKCADVFEPCAAPPPRYGVLHLHGFELETLAGNAVFTRCLQELNLACICPHGQRSWWTDRPCLEFDPQVTAERHVLDDVLPYVCERWGLLPRSVAIQGISMGGQGALRLAFKRPDLFPVVGAISPALDYHEWYGRDTPLDDMYSSKEQCRQDTALLHVSPLKFPPHIFFCIDPADVEWYRGNDRLHEKLTALGIEHQIDFSTSRGGHSWEYFNSMAERLERFVVKGLEQESRRLL